MALRFYTKRGNTLLTYAGLSISELEEMERVKPGSADGFLVDDRVKDTYLQRKKKARDKYRRKLKEAKEKLERWCNDERNKQF